MFGRIKLQLVGASCSCLKGISFIPNAIKSQVEIQVRIKHITVSVSLRVLCIILLLPQEWF
jgi:hypothetical protein